MQRIRQNGGLCHGEQKANSYNSRKNSLKTSVVVDKSHNEKQFRLSFQYMHAALLLKKDRMDAVKLFQ